MTRLAKVNKADALRPLLTEVLPHETPLWFSNAVLYERLKPANSVTRGILNSIRAPLKPLDFRIRKTTSGARRLSLIHPKAQLELCRFYEKYADLIIYYCTRSPCSLRYPSKVASAFKGKSRGENEAEDGGVDEVDSDSLFASSYFAYQRHSFLYKFFDSYDFQNLEKSYKRMSQVDIASCFHSIYTHSISWAIKNRRVTKHDLRAKGGFDRNFDSLMQSSNYLETNGIPIGPEVSRIFAEIILQEIDVRVIRRLEKNNIKHRHQFDFRRYVDDYFIFTKNDEVYEKFIEVLEDELRFFKLSLNTAKKLQIRRPFITDISIFKTEVSSILDAIFEHRFIDRDIPKTLHSPSSLANRNISKVKAAIKDRDVTYQSVSNYLLSTICRKIDRYIGTLRIKHAAGHSTLGAYRWILADLDLIFFIHAMDQRVVATEKLAKTIRAILTECDGVFDDGMEAIKKKCFDSARKAIEIFDDGNDALFPVEILNLLLVMDFFKSYRKLSADFIEKHFFNSFRKFDHLDLAAYEDQGGYYFLWVTLMLYTRNLDEYAPLQIELKDTAYSLVLNCPEGLSCTETFLLFFDYISCPDIPLLKRVRLIKKFNIKHNISDNTRTLLNQFNARGAVVDWNDGRWLERNLLKREYRFAYE